MAPMFKLYSIYKLLPQYRVMSILFLFVNHKSSRVHLWRQLLHVRRCSIFCTYPQSQFTLSWFVFPHLIIFDFTGTTAALILFKFFQFLKFRVWTVLWICGRWKVSGGSACTISKKLFLDFRRFRPSIIDNVGFIC